MLLILFNHTNLQFIQFFFLLICNNSCLNEIKYYLGNFKLAYTVDLFQQVLVCQKIMKIVVITQCMNVIMIGWLRTARESVGSVKVLTVTVTVTK